jgi:predicted porin
VYNGRICYIISYSLFNYELFQFKKGKFKMKKIAIMAALAFAATASFAEVTVYGKVRMFEESYKLGTASELTQLTDSDSRIGFKAVEDLGNGLKANVVVETSVVADAPNTGAATQLGNRQSTLGLSHAYGTIDMGRAKHTIGRALDSYDVFGNAVFSSTAVVNASQGQRLSNAAMVTAVVAKGVSVSYHRGESEVAGTPASEAASVNVNFAGVDATLATYDNNLNSTTTLAAAKYTFAPTGTTVSGIYSDNNVVGVKTKGKTVGVAQPVGKTPFTVLASYGTNELVKATNVGVNYALSKNTSLQARYIKEDNIVNTKDLQRVAFGMEMNF